jgi:LAO/AO transport system kinase
VELDIVKAADTTLLVLAPGAGDEIQTMKAGILEAADVIAINKADREGAEQLKADLEAMLAMKPRPKSDWLPPVILTEAINDKGTAELSDALLKHYEYLKASGNLARRRRERVKLELLETIEADLKEMIHGLDCGAYLEKLVEDIQKGKMSPQQASGEIIARILDKKVK